MIHHELMPETYH